MTNDPVTEKPAMSPQAFAVLGGGKIAYVKPIRSEDVQDLYPEAPQLQPGMQLFALHAADGTPILVTDTPRGCNRQCLEPRARDAQRALTRGRPDGRRNQPNPH